MGKWFNNYFYCVEVYMIKQLIVVLIFFLLTSPLLAFEGTQYGQKLTLTEITKVSDIMAQPKDYIDRRVLVEGMVVEVCAKRGCWMDVASDKAYEKIQIKVTDGQIVFPMSARGKKALVEGVVQELNLSYQQALAYYRHKAEEKGVPFDPSTVTGPDVFYRIRGIGALIEE